MARHNLAFLYGFVTFVQTSTLKNGEPFVLAFVTVARAQRNAGDHKEHLKLDNPAIMSRDPKIVMEMSKWEEYDFVEIKGTIAATPMAKVSNCTNSKCGAKNIRDGAMVYINPIFAKKRVHFSSQEECMEHLTENREISNQVFVLGTLCTDPKKKSLKEGLILTQYQIALNRKYRIRSDPPERRSDYPWVKSYGENAIQDRTHLHIGSEVFIDGCLQARKVNRHDTCDECHENYDWADRALEIVPFETEYVANYYTQEEYEAKIQKEREKASENVLTSLFGYDSENAASSLDSNNVPDDVYSQEDIDAGIESEE